MAGINDLPRSVLSTIFNFLDLESLINVKSVSQLWQECCLECTSWKSHILVINKHISLEEAQRKIVSCHKLGKVYTESNLILPRIFFWTIALNLNDISELMCSFSPPISAVHVDFLYQRHTNIKKLRLDSSAPDILDSLNFVAQNGNLNAISLIGTNRADDDVEVEQTVAICSVLEQLSLLQLDISGLKTNHNAQFNTAICHLVEFFSSNLLSLSVNIHTHQMLFHSILTCVNLTELLCTVRYTGNTNFILNLSPLSHLKCLNLNFEYVYPGGTQIPNFRLFVNNSFSASFQPNFCQHLTSLKLRINFAYFDASVLFAEILKLCLNLEVLKLTCFSMRNVCTVLTNLENLNKLKIFSLNTHEKVSNDALTDIGLCQSLKSLKFKNCLYFNRCVSDRNKEKRLQNVVAMLHALYELETLNFVGCKFNKLSNYWKSVVTNCCLERSITFIHK